LSFVPSFALMLDAESKEMKKSAWVFDPQKNKNYGSTRKKLAALWTVAVDEALKSYLKIKKKESIMWKPGFVFSDDAQAMHNTHGGVDVFLLNPVDSSGKIRYSLNNKSDRINILISAIHEVTHAECRYHDEDFTMLNDAITEDIFPRLGKITKRMTEAMKNIS